MGILVTAVFLAVAAYLVGRILYLRLRSQRTTGTIVALQRDSSGKQDTFTPVVRFTTRSGVTITAESGFGIAEAGTYFRVGERVTIDYHPDKPELFAIVGYDAGVSFFILLLIAVMLGIMYWQDFLDWLQAATE